MLASENEHLEIVIYLVFYKASLDLQSEEDWTSKSLFPYMRIVQSRQRHTLHDYFANLYTLLISQFHG